MTIATFVDERLDAMLARPKYWGSAEAFETQVLLLLEMREHLTSGLVGQQSLRAFQDRYNAFMRRHVPELGTRPLFAVVTDVTRIAALLQQFRAEPLEATPVEPMPIAPQSLGADIDVHGGFALMPRGSEAA